MPGRDGTGPMGQGPMGGGRFGSPGAGRGRMGRNMTAGPGGYCVCPKCSEIIAHRQGKPCSGMVCPKCGSRMVRVD